MTFETPGVFNNDEGYVPPVVNELDPENLTGGDLEVAFKAGAIQEEDLTPKQRLELHNKGYQVILPEGEVTLH